MDGEKQQQNHMLTEEQITDEELIDRLRGGENSIMDELCDKYKHLVRKKAKSMFILGGDNEDLIQEGMIGLFKAVRDYDAGRDASFYTFADLCISRQMYTAVQASRRQKHIPLNTYVSLDGTRQTENGEEKDGMQLAEILPHRSELSPEELFLDKERVADLENAMEQGLSSFERQVIELYMTGMTYSQIAKVLGRGEKATDNALSRAKQKIKEWIKV